MQKQAPNNWGNGVVGRGALVVSVVLLCGGACTRASQDKRDRPRQNPDAALPQAPSLSRALKTDITHFAPSSADKVGVMIRFDRMRNTPLAKATEHLLRWLPDHPRVVGNTGSKVRDVFDLVLMTSSDPGMIVTTNMSARMSVSPKQMRTMLNNTLSPTAWTPVSGGALGRSKSSSVPGGDPRVYLIPMRKWIFLAQPSSFGSLLSPRKGRLNRAAPPKTLVPWLARAGSMMNIGGSAGTLIALSTLHKLPHSISLPLFGTLLLPQRAAIALDRRKHADVFSGVLHFDTVAAAKAFAKTVEGAKRILAAYTPTAGAPKLPALRALRSVLVRRVGKRMQWSMATTRQEAFELTMFASKLIGQWARGGVPPTHGTAKP